MKKFSGNSIQIDSALLDSLQSHLAIINDEGDIIRTNQAWENFSSQSQISRPSVDENYFVTLQKKIEYGNDYALKLLLGIKQVIENRKETFSLVYPSKTENPDFWFKASIHPCDDNRYFIVLHEDVTSTEQLKNKQKKRKNRYQAHFEQSMLGILITDASGNILDANPAACDILGREQNELTNCNHDDVINTDDPAYQQALAERETSGSYQLETHLIDKKGHKIPVEISSRAYRSPSGKLRAIVSFKDISRRKHAERKLINNKHFTDSALNSIPGVFLVLNDNYNLIRWNQNLLTQLGYSDKELANKNALDFIVEEEKDKVKAKIQKAMEGEELSLETKVSSNCGEVRDYYLFAKPFEENGERFLVGSGIDITETKAVERENRKNQLMLQQLFDNSPNGIVIVDKENKIHQTNKSFQRIFNYTEEELQGENVNLLITPEDKKPEAEAISLATQNGHTLKVETVRTTKYGEEVPVLIGSVPVNLNGETIAIYGIYVDISEQYNYQKKIKKTLRDKEVLLAELHHRVKNNLALINSMLDLRCFETNNEELISELDKIKGRILTIASIHEVLFQNNNLIDIPFNKYLEEFISTKFITDHAIKNNITLTMKEGSSYLDINQSIPCGLFLTELLSLIFKYNEQDKKTNIDIHLREYGQNMHLILEGANVLNCIKEVQEDQSLHRVLVNTLVNQLEAKLLWPDPENEAYQKFELIFEKLSGRNSVQNILKKG